METNIKNLNCNDKKSLIQKIRDDYLLSDSEITQLLGILPNDIEKCVQVSNNVTTKALLLLSLAQVSPNERLKFMLESIINDCEVSIDLIAKLSHVSQDDIKACLYNSSLITGDVKFNLSIALHIIICIVS